MIDLEGYHTIRSTQKEVDCDYGECTEYKLDGFTLYFYKDHPDMISIHDDKELNNVSS